MACWGTWSRYKVIGVKAYVWVLPGRRDIGEDRSVWVTGYTERTWGDAGTFDAGDTRAQAQCWLSCVQYGSVE